MSSTSSFLAVLVVALLALNVAQLYYWTQVHDEEEEEVLKVQDIFSDNWKDYIGQEVTVEGFYINSSVPMLVSSLDLTMLDLQLPDDGYLPLTGDVDINDSVYGGSLLEIVGTVREASKQGYSNLVEDRPVLEFTGYDLITPTFPSITPYIPEFEPIPWQTPDTTKYAVLISGGVDAFNNHYRYWNDMKFMYSVLINEYGYDPDNIYVIYADGVARDGDMPVDYAATIGNVRTVFNELETEMDSQDRLFLFLNDHGGGFWPHDPLSIYLRDGRVDLGGDETDFFDEDEFHRDFNYDGDMADTLAFDEALNLWGDDMLWDDELANMLDDLDYGFIIAFMKQCFSGGFISDISGPNRIILVACEENEPAWSSDTEGDYGEFSYHFMSAVNGQTPDGVAVDADINDDSKVSMVEAFNYASTHDSRSETPYYDDNDDGIGHVAPIVPPTSGPGEGFIGKYLSL
jgi:hypothetical protein